jgi:hypothetical protein
MSSTRYAIDGSNPREERYASSPEIDRCFRAGDVARRCEALEAREDRELIWAFQFLSHHLGGKRQLTDAIFSESNKLDWK